MTLFRLLSLLVLGVCLLSSLSPPSCAQPSLPVRTYNCTQCTISACASPYTVTLWVSPYYNLNATQVCSALNSAMNAKLAATIQSTPCLTASVTATCALWSLLVTYNQLTQQSCQGNAATLQQGGGIDVIDLVIGAGSNFTRSYYGAQMVDPTRPGLCQTDLQCITSPTNTTLASYGYCGNPMKSLVLWGSQLNSYTFNNATSNSNLCTLCHIGVCDSLGYNLDVYLGGYGNLADTQVCTIVQTTSLVRMNGINPLLPNASTCLLQQQFQHVCPVWLELSVFTSPLLCGLTFIDYVVGTGNAGFQAACASELSCLNSSLASTMASYGYCSAPAEAIAHWGAPLVGLTLESSTANCYYCTVGFCNTTIAINATSSAQAMTLCQEAQYDISLFEQHTLGPVCQASLGALICGGLQLAAFTEYGCDASTIGQGTADGNTTLFTQGCLGIAATCLDATVNYSLVASGACNGFNQFIHALQNFSTIPVSSSTASVLSLSSSSSSSSTSSFNSSTGNSANNQFSSTAFAIIFILSALLTTLLL